MRTLLYSLAMLLVALLLMYLPPLFIDAFCMPDYRIVIAMILSMLSVGISTSGPPRKEAFFILCFVTVFGTFYTIYRMVQNDESSLTYFIWCTPTILLASTTAILLITILRLMRRKSSNQALQPTPFGRG